MRRALPPATRRTAALLVCLTVLAGAGATPALARDAKSPARKPSARELWRDYPLAPSPTARPTVSAEPGTTAPGRPAAARGGSPARRAPAAHRAAADPGGGSSVLLVVLAVVAAAAVAVAALLVVRRRARPSEPRLRSPAPNAVAQDGAPLPGDPDQPWSAEIAWRERGGRASFEVVAAPEAGGATTTLATCGDTEWPPSSPGDVEAITESAQALEGWMLAWGWEPLPPGDAWYAKRFAWRPKPPEERAVPTTRRTPDARPSRR